MCRLEEGLDGMEGGCGCLPGSNRKKGTEPKEEITRLKERKRKLEQEIAEVDRRRKELNT